MTALVRTLKERQISLTGVTEAHLVGGGTSAVEEATVLHSGGCHPMNSSGDVWTSRRMSDRMVAYQ